MAQDTSTVNVLIEQCRQGALPAPDQLCQALAGLAHELELSGITIDRLQQQVFAVDQHAIISITDGRGVILYVNEKFCETSQYAYEELVGKTHHIINSGYHPPAFFADMWNTIAGGGTWRGEVCDRKKNGDIYWVETTIVPFPTPDGAGYHYVAVRTDVTALKLYENKLKAANEELEQRVRRRTAALVQTNEQLITSNAELKELNQKLESAQSQLLQSEKMASIGQLAAGVAHEINNPIGYVHSNLGSLGKYIQDLMSIMEAFEAAARDCASTCDSVKRVDTLKENLDLAFLKEDIPNLLAESREGITRVKKIVQDLKDFSHVDEAEWQMVDLHRGLDSTLNIVWNELKYKAEVVKDYGALPEIECLPSQLNQVFMNLLVNAAHAIESRGIITLRSGVEGEKVWVEVADNGKGIAPEHINRIFEPFFTTKPTGKGTGLGLSLSYGIVKKHHGTIEVGSQPGKGATFRVWLPVKQPEEKA